MHHVLLIDEILRSVFAHVDDDANRNAVLDAFARLAVVCRAWKDPALDVLWESLSSMDPLFALLPSVSRSSDSFTIADAPSPAVLANFYAHASRVRSVQYSARLSPRIPPTLLSHLALGGPFILPSLASVRLNLSDPLKRALPAPLFLSPNLRTLSIDIGFGRKAATTHPGESLCAYVDAVARLAPSLHHLSLRGRVGERVLDTVATLRGLRTLSLCVGADMSPRTLAAVGEFPQLKGLRVQLDGMDVDELHDALDGSERFAALERLEVRGAPAALEALIACFPTGGSHLKTVELESDLKPRSVDSWTTVFALLADKAADSLQALTVESHTSFCEMPDLAQPPKLHFTLGTLAPLAKVAGLRRFALDASIPADVNDADLATVARWWPAIEHLGLWTRPVEAFDYPTYFTMQPRATLASLPVFAQLCPALRVLSVPMDVAAVPAAVHPPMAAASQSTLDALTVGCARKGDGVDVDGLAEYLYRAFPSVREIDFDCGEETSWGDVSDAYRRLQARLL
ncbi:hypothetical protein OF83DRAFT_1176675 [Amylostereum chailletii]|nr:hypothetical protein OF83DRAFT_1176675 [Amylostereum chailletii]